MSRLFLQLGAVGALTAGYLAVLLTVPTSDSRVLSMSAQVAVMAGCAVALARVAIRSSPTQARAWWAAAASALASSLIFVVWMAYDARDRVVPVPSPADVPYFAAVTLMIVAALLLFAADDGRTDRVRVTLDGAIVATSLLLISWSQILGPTVRRIDGLSLEAVVLVAYPVADVVSATIIVIVLGRSGPAVRIPLALLAAGVLALTVGDTAYGMFSLAGSWSPGHPASVFWLVGYPLILVAALQSRDVSAAAALGAPTEAASTTRVRVALLMVPVVIALTVTVLGEQDRAALAVMALLVVLVLIQQTTALHGELYLRATLERQVAAQTAALRDRVYQDTVTSLGNRTLLQERARSTDARVDPAALLLLDLDGFKEINDTLGHAAGDAVLVQIGDRLGLATRSQDTVVRMGGDEFAVLLPGTGRTAALTAAERILVELRLPVQVGTHELTVAGSIGVALASNGLEVDELLRQADLAMYEAKAAGGERALLFDPRMHDRLSDRLQAEAGVRTGLESGQFTCYYQPIVDAESGEIVCLEALARWDHPERGVLSPYDFLPAAERTGDVVELGRQILRQVCAQLATWRQDWSDLRVAVNLSHRELLDPDLPARVQAALDEAGLPACALHLEITETVLASAAEIRDPLNSLVDLGVSLSMDDFGTGHSSLSRIRDMPVGRLKIDRSFVGEIQGDSAPLLESILALGRSLNMVTVAEGVETEAQLDFLTRHGCRELQGYLFSRPVPAEHVVPLLFSTRLRSPSRLDPDSTPFPRLVAALVAALEDEDREPDDTTVPELLRELSELAGLESTFITSVGGGRQEVLAAHNGESMTFTPGSSLDWGATLCRRMLDDDRRHVTHADERYDDLAVVHDLGINTYVAIPIHNSDGDLVGTLCGASVSVVEIDDTLLSLMDLFAGVLASSVSSGGSRGAAFDAWTDHHA